jgi:hypothetical protein
MMRRSCHLWSLCRWRHLLRVIKLSFRRGAEPALSFIVIGGHLLCVILAETANDYLMTAQRNDANGIMTILIKS